MRWIAASAALVSAALTVHAAPLEGLVVEEGARPVAGARVESLPSGTVVTTDSDGRFRIDHGGEAATLVVRHPLYEVREVRIAPDDRTVTIALRPRIAVRQEVSVTAAGAASPRPQTLPASDVDPRAAAGPVASVTDLVSEVPGVSQNGQGGLLQSVSIRGESRQRVLTFVGGMRVVTDRRAGTAASFVDPLLLASASVTRGPAATTRGAGALGGSLELWPRRVDGWEARLGYDSQGDGTHALAGWGRGDWSVAAVHRRAEDGRAADGTPLTNGYSQISSVARGGWRAGATSFELLLVAAAARDVGKASTDAPLRTTVYPEDDHVMLKLGLETPREWLVEAWIHASELETLVVDAADVSRVVNESDDFGVSTGRSWRLGDAVDFRAALEHFGRRNVGATETRAPRDDPAAATMAATLSSGEEDETGLLAQVSWSEGRVHVDGGARLIRHRQTRGGDERLEGSAVTAFGGVSYEARHDLELSLHAGSGTRYPALGERFFSGTTGRGRVIGNAGLGRERSVGLDAGLRWKGERSLVTVHAFHQRVSDLIQRVELEPGLLTFENVLSGRIRGLEVETATELASGWSLEAGGHALEGRDALGLPLADVPASRLHAGVRRRAGRWTWRSRVELRAPKTDPASGEKRTPRATLVTASLEYVHPAGMTVRFDGRNLLDEPFFASADRKVPLAPGRSLGIAIVFRR